MTRCYATCRGSMMRSKRCSMTCGITGFVKICGWSKNKLASSGLKLHSPLLQDSEIASLPLGKVCYKNGLDQQETLRQAGAKAIFQRACGDGIPDGMRSTGI